MSNRTLIELNHDFCPSTNQPDKVFAWALGLISYMRSGDKRDLPAGITFKHMRHHSDPDPMEGRGDPS